MRRARTATILGCILILAGCSSNASTSGFSLAEFSISGPDNLAAGSQTVSVENSGEFPHTLVITDSTGHVVAATDLIQPGESASLDVDLEQGRYSFTCRVVAETGDGAIIDHFEMGMNETVDVGG